MNKIFTAKDYAKRDRAPNTKAWIRTIAEKKKHVIDDTVSGGNSVYAEINAGRWIAKCPDCNGAEAVDPDERVFYCLSCGNERVGGKHRKVVFPKNWKAIEKEILKRPVKVRPGRDPIAQAFTAIPDKLPRAWTTDETLEDIQKQNKEVGL
jgi:hypothetical protein